MGCTVSGQLLDIQPKLLISNRIWNVNGYRESGDLYTTTLEDIPENIQECFYYCVNNNVYMYDYKKIYFITHSTCLIYQTSKPRSDYYLFKFDGSILKGIKGKRPKIVSPNTIIPKIVCDNIKQNYIKTTNIDKLMSTAISASQLDNIHYWHSEKYRSNIKYTDIEKKYGISISKLHIHSEDLYQISIESLKNGSLPMIHISEPVVIPYLEQDIVKYNSLVNNIDIIVLPEVLVTLIKNYLIINL